MGLDIYGRKYVEITNKVTGEIVTVDTTSYNSIVEAWREAQELERMGKLIKDNLKDAVRDLANHKGLTEEKEGYHFRVTQVQRYQYDKATMRSVLEEDIFDLMLKPDKKLVDTYIKENLEILGDTAKMLRDGMIPDGKAYEVIKLERLG